jgi:hypothetical protein
LDNTLTLVTVSNVNHALMEFSMEKTISAVQYLDEIKIFSNKMLGLSKSYDFIDIGDQFSLADYSVFLMKELNQYIDTTHVLVTQYDGFGVNSEYWKEEYFEYDFIGPPTSFNHPPIKSILAACRIAKTGWFVGGGGFSLRSKKLLNALQDPKIKVGIHNYLTNTDWCSEDISICIVYKEYLEKEHGIKFAPVELAIDFGAEYLTGYDACLGFHGLENIPFFLTEQECTFYLQNLKVNRSSYKLLKLIGNLYCKNYATLLSSDLIKHILNPPLDYNN